MIGRTIAHFEVIAKLGEGGMGVVYKARDTHLDRFVALKVLPPDKLADAERKRRFIQEAKSASALNHPNIVHIYDIEESDGVLFIAMEYVAGKSLDALIAASGRPGLRPEAALKYAVQTADALGKAHNAGIVHRDLKPSNLMVTEDGLVKVLDFGLAKLTDQIEPEAQLQQETLTAMDKPHTADGQILGTAAYMSPEQAEGRKVDSRSDIFSFGAVLYEMITGRRVFQRGSQVATLSAVLKEEPPPASQITGSLPADWDRIITRCLRKDPDRRWQTMADLRVSLQELKEESESGRIAAPPPEHHGERSRTRWLAGALAVAVVLLAGAAWMLFHNRQPPAPPVVAWKPIPLTALPGRTGHPSFSTDGSQVAFVWDGEDGRPHVYIKLVGPGRPLRLTQGQANDWGPAWSPDGRFIAFYREITVDRFALMLVPALGGVERKVTEFDVQPYNLIGPAWFPDSASLVISARSPGSPRNSLQRISIETSEMVPLFEPPASATHGDDAPSIAPDGHALAFTRSTINSLGYLNVVPLTADGKAAGPPKQISTGTITIIYIAWAPDGRDLIVSSGRRGNMFRIPSDGTGPLVNLGLRDGSQQSVSARSNRLAYVEARLEINLWEADLNGSARVKGPLRRLTQAAGRKVNAQYSPDGKRIAFSSNRTGSQEIWVAEADGGNASPITSLGANVTGSPHWSPDGQKIAFDCNIRGGVYDVYVVSAEGGKPQPLTNKDSSFAPAWSADGRRIYFASNRTGRNEVWSMDPTGKDVKQITRNGGMGPQPSADGSTIYYSHGEGNTATLMKVPAAGGEEEKVLDGLYRYSFAPVAKGVYYLAATPKLSIRFLDFATGKSTEVLSGTDEQDLGLAVSADGRRILFSKVDQFESDLMLVENFR